MAESSSNSVSEQLQAWLTLATQGDRAARDRLVEHTYQRLLCLTRRLLRDYEYLRGIEGSMDVLQNVQMRLLTALERNQPPTPADFFRLAGTLIRRELIDMVRHHYGPEGEAAHRVEADTRQMDQAGGSSLDGARLAAWTEFHAQVESMPTEEKEAFDLLYYQELPQAEAAVVLQVSLATLKRRWLAARMRLGNLLRPDDP